MATIGVATTVTSVGPSGIPEVAFSNLYAAIQTPWGIDNVWQICSSFQDFVRLYGGLNKVTIGSPDVWSNETTAKVQQAYYAVKGYFDEKQAGSPGVAFICRVVATSSGPTAASKTFSDGGSNNTTVAAKWKGKPGGSITCQVANPSPAKGTGWARLTITFAQGNITEYWDIATAVDAASATKKSQLVTITLPSGGQLPVTAAAAKLDSGTPATADPYTASASDMVGTTTGAGVKTGLQVFNDNKLGSGMVIVPGYFDSTTRSGIGTHCNSYDRVAFLGSPSGLTQTSVVSDLSTLSCTQGELDYTWPNIYVADQASDSAGQILVDPCGHISGLAARMDKIWKTPIKPPAGLNYPLVTALDVERTSSNMELVDDSGSNTLADSFINTIRIKGNPSAIISWGLRTLSTDNRFRQIGVARLTKYIKLTCTLILERYVMEVINPRLFGKVKAELDGFFSGVYRNEALYGTEPGKDPRSTDAWFTVCDAGNNPGVSIANGELHADVTFVPAPSAEKITLNLGVAAPGFVLRAQ